MALSWRFDQSSLELETGTDIALLYLIEAWYSSEHYDLDSLLARSVMEFNEAEVLATRANGACPACNSDDLVHEFFVVVEELGNPDSVSIGDWSHDFLICWELLHRNVVLAHVVIGFLHELTSLFFGLLFYHLSFVCANYFRKGSAYLFDK